MLWKDERLELEWKIFQGFATFCKQKFMSQMGDQQQHLHVDVQRDEDNEQVCRSDTNIVFINARKIHQEDVLCFGHGSEKKRYSTHDSKPQGEWDRVAELMMRKNWRKRTPSFPCHESTVQRNAQKQRRWKFINTLLR